MPFFIRRMDTKGYIKAAEVPPRAFPLVSFAYLTGGEILVEAEGELFHCTAGHLFLLPENRPFSILYYRDAHGYTGGFPASMAGEKALIAQPLHFAFWFEEAQFAGELFNMMARASEKNKGEFIQNAVRLLLDMLPANVCGHPGASNFLRQIFNPDLPFGELDGKLMLDRALIRAFPPEKAAKLSFLCETVFTAVIIPAAAVLVFSGYMNISALIFFFYIFAVEIFEKI